LAIATWLGLTGRLRCRLRLRRDVLKQRLHFCLERVGRRAGVLLFGRANGPTRVVPHDQVRRLMMAFERLVDSLDREGFHLLDLANGPIVVDGKEIAEGLVERLLDIGNAELLLRATFLVAGLPLLPARMHRRFLVADLVVVTAVAALPVAVL